jgi:hypothetical protein
MFQKTALVKTGVVCALRNHTARLFFASVGEVVFDGPGLAAISGTAAELTDFV